MDSKNNDDLKKSPETEVQSSVTESSNEFANLDQMSAYEILTNINEEDRKVPKAVAKCIPKIEKLVLEMVSRMEKGGKVFYLGAGTSGRLGVLDASELPPTFGVPENIVIGLIAGGDTALRHAVEAAEDDYEKAWNEMNTIGVGEFDTVIGIAASGTTPYVIGGVRKAKEHGLLTACITCNPDSNLSKEVEIPIEAVVGPEIITGSTRLKAGTAQKLILNMITTTTMIKLGRVKGNKMVNMQLTNKKLVERGTKMIIEELNIPYEEAKALLLKHRSVKKAVDAYRSEC